MKLIKAIGQVSFKIWVGWKIVSIGVLNKFGGKYVLKEGNILH